MSDDRPTDRPAQGTHCEWCGAEYETDDAPTPPARARAGRPSQPAPRPPAGAPDDALTHCEWCGAEYPSPAGAD